MLKNNRISSLLIFLFWSLYSFLSSGYDWDLGFTTLEIDVRAFWETLSFPKWSYQLCGGITRVGDVNSSAESLWFLLPLIFGSYVGMKLIVPVGMTISSVVLANYINDEFKINNGIIYSLLFSLNGFWLLHFTHGHAGYVSQFLFICSCLLYHRYLINGFFKDVAYASLTFYLAFSLGMYQVVAYMAIPFVFSYIVAHTVNFLLTKRFLLKKNKMLIAISSILFVVFLNIHKLIEVWKYQQNFPRTVSTSESYGFVEYLYSLFLPSLNELRPINLSSLNIGVDFVWGIHEYSYFSPLNFLVIVLSIILFLGKKKKIDYKGKNILFYIIILITLFVLSSALFFGEFSDFSPYYLLNKYLYARSQRVPSRYMLWGAFCLFMVFVFVMENAKMKNKKLLITICFIISFYQLIVVFSNLKRVDFAINRFKENVFRDIPFVSKMKDVVVIKPQYPAYAYHLIKRNVSVLQCYTPLKYEHIIHYGFYEKKLSYNVPYFFLVKEGGGEIDKQSDCYRGSYFTNERIVVSDACPKTLELRLANVNSNLPIKNYKFKKDFNNNKIILYKK